MNYFTQNYITPIANPLLKNYVDFFQILVIFCKSLLASLYCLPVAVAGADIFYRKLQMSTTHLSY